MKIFVDGTVLEQPATGIAKSTLQLYKSCLELMPSLEVTVLHKRPIYADIPSEIRTLQIGSHISDGLWRLLILPGYVYKNRPDFVHFPWNGNVPYLFDNSKVIVTINDVLPLIIPDYFKSAPDKRNYIKNMQKSINRSDLIFTISKYSKKEIIENFSVNVDIGVIYLASTVENEYLDSYPHPGFRYFLYVGGYDPRKGLETLLKVFIRLHKEKSLKSKLVLTGSKNYYSSSFRSLVDEGVKLGIVIEKGYVTEEELAYLYSNAMALIYPSKYEGFGLPPLEAMSLGCPVVTTKFTSIPEVCGEAACYIDVDNELDFARVLVELENNDKLRKKLETKGRIQASKFSWSTSAEIFLNKLNKSL
jgi:glycosyltransferase involved in cell wall biosynthesis